MKYQPTIFVDNELCTKLQNGESLSPGQWIQLTGQVFSMGRLDESQDFGLSITP